MTNKDTPYTMTNEEVGQYINTVLEGKAVQAADAGEMHIMGEFKLKMTELKNTEAELARAEARVTSLKLAMEQSRGAVNTLSTLLVRVEDARRSAKDPPAGGSNRKGRRAAKSKGKKAKNVQPAVPEPAKKPNGATGAQQPA